MREMLSPGNELIHCCMRCLPLAAPQTCTPQLRCESLALGRRTCALRVPLRHEAVHLDLRGAGEQGMRGGVLVKGGRDTGFEGIKVGVQARSLTAQAKRRRGAARRRPGR